MPLVRLTLIGISNSNPTTKQTGPSPTPLPRRRGPPMLTPSSSPPICWPEVSPAVSPRPVRFRMKIVDRWRKNRRRRTVFSFFFFFDLLLFHSPLSLSLEKEREHGWAAVIFPPRSLALPCSRLVAKSSTPDAPVVLFVCSPRPLFLFLKKNFLQPSPPSSASSSCSRPRTPTRKSSPARSRATLASATGAFRMKKRTMLFY